MEIKAVLLVNDQNFVNLWMIVVAGTRNIADYETIAGNDLQEMKNRVAGLLQEAVAANYGARKGFKNLRFQKVFQYAYPRLPNLEFRHS